MSKVKYRVREFTPTENMTGRTHSFFAEAIIDNEITNTELAERIARRTGFKTYECQAVVAAIAEVVAEEVLESNRVSLCDERGTRVLSIYPKVSGSVSDAEVQANGAKYDGATKATEEMLTPDQLTWTLGATIGIKFSRQFALNKQAQKVDYNPAQTTAEPSDSDEPTVTPGGGDDPNSGND